MAFTDRIEGLNRWLLTDGRAAPSIAEFLAGYIQQLLKTGCQIDRATIGAPLAHPVARSSYSFWLPDKPPSQQEFLWDKWGMDRLANSPMYPIYMEGRDIDWRITPTAEPGEYGIGEDMRAEGFTHYFALALPFSDGSFKAATFQTKRPGGFDKAEMALLRALVPALAATLEIFVHKAFANTLMETFVGERAGKRVLNGQIHRGDGEMIRAVIWMSDIRGFTALAAHRDTADVIDSLNRCFETVTEAVSDSGGEVLKFIGDALLGIFPVVGDPSDAVAQAEVALDRLSAAMDEPDWPKSLHMGVALHLGEVFYGNIGGKTRLDFTVIGPAVNLVSRVENLCSALGAPILVTRDIVELSTRTYHSRGDHAVKGVDERVEVFSPAG
ncbi:MAG: adenylate/guanylate cyclase domain-containing protein [Arenibacterium sp.]